MQTWHIYTDGGSRGNPGESACAFVVTADAADVHSEGLYLGTGTNNEAEYAGVIASLRWVISQDLSSVEKIEWFTDSQLVMSQINKLWKIKEPRIQRMVTEIWALQGKLHKPFSIRYVPREKNQEADLLVNQTLDAHLA